MTSTASRSRSLLASAWLRAERAQDWNRWASIGRLVGRRLVWLLPVLLAVVVITFGLLQVAPGSPWDPRVGEGAGGVNLSDTAIAHLDAHYGLDEPWWDQLGRYMGNTLQFDFGESYQYRGQDVSDLILERWPRTFVFGLICIVFIFPVGIALGLLAALRHNSARDHAVTGLATFGASIPSFVVGLFLIMLFSVGLNRATDGAVYLPAGGFGLDEHLILPVLTLSLLPIAFIARLTRSSALETKGQDHVRTARAKGLGERSVVLNHVLKNSLVPVTSALGPMFANLVTGTVVVETLFGMRGLGAMFVEAVTVRDYPMILGLTIVVAVVVALANLAVDVLYVLIDPRVKPS